MQIIQKKTSEVESDWQKEIANAFKNPIHLLNYLKIDHAPFSEGVNASRLFPMMVPRFFAGLMQMHEPADPLLKQVLPVKDEFLSVDGFTTDPLKENNHANDGVVHKYKNRVLLILKGGCAINCRYCFRRHFPYQQHHLNRALLLKALNKIESDPNIDEIILSGGDPLMANDQTLNFVVSAIEEMSNIKRIRFHTRLPVVLPSRITTGLLNTLHTSRMTISIVLHINHPNEISESLQIKCKALARRGVRLFNQAVLLKDINDSAAIQMKLNETLFESGIQPYYLHMFDKVKGASHFCVSEQTSKRIMRNVVANQSGYMVPKLVLEEPGRESKTWIDIYAD